MVHGETDAELEPIRKYVPRFLWEYETEVLHAPVEPTGTRLSGALLFMDIAGFTHLAGRYSRLGPLGAEQLYNLIEPYFRETTSIIEDQGGDLIHFAGDAVLATWPRRVPQKIYEAASLACQCASLLMQRFHGTAFGAENALRIRASVGAGDLQIVRVGGVGGQWKAIVTGNPLKEIAVADKRGRPGEILITPTAWPYVEGLATGRLLPSGHHVLDSIDDRQIPYILIPAMPDIAVEYLKAFVPQIVADHARLGKPEWLATFTQVSLLFIALPQFTFRKTSSLHRLQGAARVVQEEIQRLEGTVHQFQANDKGMTFICGFGLPPQSHEDDPERAIEAALRIRQRFHEYDLRPTTGVTTGRLFCGEYGNETRRDFTIVGPSINLAAHLSQAATDAVFCDDRTRKTAMRRFDFAVADIHVRKAPDDTFYIPTGRNKRRRKHRRYSMVGRRPELNGLLARFDSLQQGQGGLVFIEGEAGIGKSRLLTAFVDTVRVTGATVLRGQGDAIEQTTSFLPWREIITDLLYMESSGCAPSQALQVAIQDNELLSNWAPLMGAILPLDLAENEITKVMDAPARALAIQDIVVYILQRATASSRLVLALEDAHWFDYNSLILAEAVSRRLGSLLMVVTSRPLTNAPSGRARDLFKRRDAHHIVLHALDETEEQQLLCRCLNVDRIHPQLLQMVHSRAEGHPFFAEELMLALVESGLAILDKNQVSLVEDADHQSWSALPDTIEGVVTSRFHRLSPEQQLLLKAASLIGRHFNDRILRAIYPLPATEEEFNSMLEATVQAHLVAPITQASDPASQDYFFHNALIQDAIDSTMSSSQRQSLHAALARWYEQEYGQDDPRHAALLAHHWQGANKPEEALRCLEMAGQAAIRSFSNREAIDFFSAILVIDSRFPDLSDAPRRARWEQQMGHAYAYLTDYPAAIPHLRASIQQRRLYWPGNRLMSFLDLNYQVLRQLAHRLLPHRFIGSTKRSADHEAASVIWQRYGEVMFFNNDTLLTFQAVFRSLNHAELSGMADVMASAYASIAVVMGNLRLHRFARSYVRRADEMAPKGSLACQAFSDLLASVYANNVANWSDSVRRMARALPIWEKVGDHFRWEMCQGVLGYLYLTRGEFSLAEQTFQDIHDSVQVSGSNQLLIWSTAGTVLTGALLGEERPQQEAELLGHLQDDSLQAADLLLGQGALAMTHLQRQDHAEAMRRAVQALETIERQQPVIQYTTYPTGAAADVFLDAYDRQRAAEGSSTEAGSTDAIQRLIRVTKALRMLSMLAPAAEARYRLVAGALASRQGKKKRALKMLNKSLSLSTRHDLHYEAARSHLELYHLGAGPEHLEQGRSLLKQIGVTWIPGVANSAL